MGIRFPDGSVSLSPDRSQCVHPEPPKLAQFVPRTHPDLSFSALLIGTCLCSTPSNLERAGKGRE
mgnify:FL=1|jgi:hypothetical protein